MKTSNRYGDSIDLNHLQNNPVSMVQEFISQSEVILIELQIRVILNLV